MSLITFRSQTQGSVIMFGEDAKQLLTTLNLPASGEISTAEIAALVTRLEKIIEIDKASNPVIWPDDLDTDPDLNAPIPIQLAQRAIPMLHLLKRCESATETILW